MPSPITFGGLASGIDTNSIIDKLVQVERQPITTLQQERTDQQTRKALVTGLTGKLTALADTLKPLELQSGLQGRAIPKVQVRVVRPGPCRVRCFTGRRN